MAAAQAQTGISGRLRGLYRTPSLVTVAKVVFVIVLARMAPRVQEPLRDERHD